ncbi:GntR family transcriptional regulator [Phaeacidiphilus oryzae]|uniref:GntR family transcriptional regulator n=1 Tax=Phaeacidiphilus oryzae TaxID=348818 RepID=UPI00055A4581|nr:GntR family transcriptional regulator [Phaeacidiphilus oryzae]
MTQSPDARPTYKDIASKIREDIERGALSPGERLPTGRELAEREGVHLMTVQNAYRLLRDEGLVVSQQGRGTFVRDPASPVGEEHGGSPAFAALSKELAAIHRTLGDLSERLERLERAADDKG